MKIVKNLTLPVLVFLVMGLASCSSDDNTVHYSTNSLKNTELMTVLKSKVISSTKTVSWNSTIWPTIPHRLTLAVQT